MSGQEREVANADQGQVDSGIDRSSGNVDPSAGLSWRK
jgi:hypothetical protein